MTLIIDTDEDARDHILVDDVVTLTLLTLCHRSKAH